MSYQFPTTPGAGGYCSKHGAYTGFGCPVCASEPPAGATWANPYEPVLQQIAGALELIAAALTSPKLAEAEQEAAHWRRLIVDILGDLPDGLESPAIDAARDVILND